jgi:hypothetical protein
MTDFLDIIHHLSVIKDTTFQSGFCLRLQVKPTMLGPVNGASPCLWTRGFGLACMEKTVFLEMAEPHYT